MRKTCEAEQEPMPDEAEEEPLEMESIRARRMHEEEEQFLIRCAIRFYRQNAPSPIQRTRCKPRMPSRAPMHASGHSRARWKGCTWEQDTWVARDQIRDQLVLATFEAREEQRKRVLGSSSVAAAKRPAKARKACSLVKL